MVVPRPKTGKSMSDKVKLIFEPFSTSLWIAIISITFGFGILYVAEGDWEKSGCSISSVVKNVFNAIFRSFGDRSDDSAESYRMNTPRRILVVPWAMFTTVIMAA